MYPGLKDHTVVVNDQTFCLFRTISKIIIFNFCFLSDK